MPKHLHVLPHLPMDELEQRYRRAHDPVERSHYQINWLLAQGKLTREVMEVTGYSRLWIQQLARRYNTAGPAGLGDRRHQNPGQPLALDAAGQAALREALGGPAPDAGVWTGRSVARWLSQRLEHPVSRQQGWVWLRRLGYTPQLPRPAHARRSRGPSPIPKRLRERVAELKCAHPGSPVDVWAQDEHRVGLKPIPRRVWSPQGLRPVVSVRPRYEWCWVSGFVRPADGATDWWLLPPVTADAFAESLAAFAKTAGAGPDHPVLLVLDQAGWHTAHQVVPPDGLYLEFLPAYSPELQPAERLWPLLNEGVANRVFATLEDLETALAERIKALVPQTDRIRDLTHFHWWPSEVVHT